MAEQGRIDEALQLLEVGEPMILKLPEERGKFLCREGHVLWLNQDSKGARAALSQARELLSVLGLVDTSPLARSIAALSASTG